MTQPLKKTHAKNVSLFCHDIRNPLSTVMSSISQLKTDTFGPTTKEQKTLINISQKSLHKMKVLIDDFSLYTKLSEKTLKPELEPLFLNTLISQTIDGINVNEISPININYTQSNKAKQVNTDSTLMLLAFEKLFNVLINLATTDVSISETTNNNSHTIIFQINNTTLEQEDLDNFFDSFRPFRTPTLRKKPMNGLDLPLVYLIINQHGGKIELKNNKNGFEVLITTPNVL